MIIPKKLKKGDIIGIVAPSNPITGENIEEIRKAKEIVEKDGFKVKFSKNLFSNTNGYSSTAKEKAEDINRMFADKEVKMIWCAKGGQNSNSTFEYLDYELIKNNPKIICGYSDITSLTNMITAKTGLVTFSATNFKTIATDETDYSYKEALKRFEKDVNDGKAVDLKDYVEVNVHNYNNKYSKLGYDISNIIDKTINDGVSWFLKIIKTLFS